MVRGLNTFRAHFSAYAEHYILIGGTACDLRFEEKGLDFRQTKDLDIILVVEALSGDFLQHFWAFIAVGQYQIAEVDNRRRFYRFHSPRSDDYPQLLELFARHPDQLAPPEGLHITDIPTGEDVSSLSAILMDEDYYQFTMANSDTTRGLHLAGDIALIALKAKAFLNNRQRKAEDQSVRQVDIDKHRNDVVRLTATIPGDKAQAVPTVIRDDVRDFIQVFREEPDNTRDLLKKWGLMSIQKEEIISRLQLVFDLR